MSVLWFLVLFACSDDVSVETVSVPVEPVDAVLEQVEPAPSALSLSDVVAFDVDASHAESLKGSPVLSGGYDDVLKTLREPLPGVERVSGVGAIREKTLADEPVEDAASIAHRERFELAVNDALASFFMAYVLHIIEGASTDEEKADAVQALEAVMMQGWNWDLAARDVVQAKLMMASRSL